MSSVVSLLVYLYRTRSPLDNTVNVGRNRLETLDPEKLRYQEKAKTERTEKADRI